MESEKPKLGSLRNTGWRDPVKAGTVQREEEKTECIEMTAVEGWKRGRRHDWRCERRSGRSAMRLAVLPLAGSGKIP